MEKTGITIISNFGLDPVIAVCILATGIINSRETKKINFGLKLEQIHMEYIPPEIATYFIPANCILEELEKSLGDEKLLIIVGYPNANALSGLLSRINRKMNVVLIGHQCSAYLASTILEDGADIDYLQTAALWCETQHIRLKESVIKACRGNKEIAMSIKKRYDDAWKVNFNLHISDAGKQAFFYSEFAKELTYGTKSKHIERLLTLKTEMEKETCLLVKDVQDIGQGIGLIRTGSKPFFKDDVLQYITDTYLVGVIEYVRDNEKEHIIVYRNQLDFRVTDVQVNTGGVIFHPVGRN